MFSFSSHHIKCSQNRCLFKALKRWYLFLCKPEEFMVKTTKGREKKTRLSRCVTSVVVHADPYNTFLLLPACREGRVGSGGSGLGRGPGTHSPAQGAVQEGTQGQEGGEE